MDYLKNILLGKKKEIKSLDEKFKIKDVVYKKSMDKSFNFIENLSNSRVNIIAEIKKASPSRGMMNINLDIEKVALLYCKYRRFISAISVITEPIYFKGNRNYIKIVKEVSSLPILRKDFIFHEDQIYESAVLGADCILLISSILGQKKLNKLFYVAKSLGLDVLVEVNNIREFDKALSTGARLIGINNRNLRNMEVDINNTHIILEQAVSLNIKDKIFVCESGIENVNYIKDLYEKGSKAFLIGSYFMQSKNLDYDLANMEERLKRKNLI
ncbi:MAG: indole-3-glycerol phosphate synthase TrpC [Actinobacteria bacterium]|nr:indole-3-glycerol phosphate synthase TrpC [Actinomycetota bacterium]